ncbi:MAG TPA: glycosyltransferase [Bacteroidia bacterium]|nr:glycosyltransferase [Bacteroidia bacterium]
MKPSIIFLFPYPLNEAPSQRFRFVQYLNILKREGYYFETHAYLSDNAWKILYQPGHFFSKFLRIVRGYLIRLLLLPKVKKFDYVFIHREAAPLGPPFIEFIIAKVLGKKIIYDFDDAIWLPNYSESNKFFSFIKWYSNSKLLCKWAYKVSCGNDYLCSFARQFNSNVVYNPTTIDTDNYHNLVSNQDKQKFVIGWTGSHSTTRYLHEIEDVLKRLEQKYDFELQVIADIPPALELKSFKFIKWSKEQEINDLLNFNIGIMPLKDDQWAAGKCGFKALQYMALGIPALVSPVGVNTKIVDHEVNGFICQTLSDWELYIEKLLKDHQLLITMAKQTRIKIIEHYSVKSNTANFLSLFS